MHICMYYKLYNVHYTATIGNIDDIVMCSVLYNFWRNDFFLAIILEHHGPE